MILTVDTSVAVKWLVDQPGSEAAAAYLHAVDDRGDLPRYQFSAPSLLLLEVHNVLGKLFKNGQISYGVLVQGAETIANIVIVDPIDTIFAIAASKRSIAAPYRYKAANRIPLSDIERSFNVYDCAFIEHAAANRQMLITCDEEQTRVARAFGVEVEWLGAK